MNITGTGTTISSFAYRVDGVGNRQGVTESDGTRVTWGYDNAYQLTHEQRSGTNAYNVTYAYDPVGRRTSMVDPNGNAGGGVPAQHTWQYGYDDEDRVTSVSAPAFSVTTLVIPLR